MQRLRSSSGFTVIELVIVLAIMGILTAFAVPTFGRYRNREEAKEMTSRIAGVLRNTRALTMKQGVPHFVLFNPDQNEPELLLRVYRDNDGDFQQDPGELVQELRVQQLETSPVTPYNAPSTRPPFGTGRRAPNDSFGGTLASIDTGASFPLDLGITPTHANPSGLPAIGFTTRGLSVRVDNPGAVGGATGVYYVTDNDGAVYAATISALGEVRVRTYSGGTDEWR